jgi:hypothetical protein
MRTRFPTYCARLRLPLLWAAGALLLGSLLGGPAWAGPTGLVLLAAGMALYFRVGTVRRPPVEVDAPVTGRWLAVNSPADKVPSHGLHAYGQTYAIDIDLVHEPTEGSRPEFGAGPAFRPPESSRPSAGRSSPRPTRRSSGPTAASGTTAAAAPGRACSTCSPRAPCASSPGPAGSSATTWSWTLATAPTRCWPTCAAAPCG